MVKRMYGPRPIPEEVLEAVDRFAERQTRLTGYRKSEASSALAVLVVMVGGSPALHASLLERVYQDEALALGEISASEHKTFDHEPEPLPDRSPPPVRRRVGAVFYNPVPSPLISRKPASEVRLAERPGGMHRDWTTMPEGTQIELLYNGLARPGFLLRDDEAEADGLLRVELDWDLCPSRVVDPKHVFLHDDERDRYEAEESEDKPKRRTRKTSKT